MVLCYHYRSYWYIHKGGVLLTKVQSGRFWMAIMFTITACAGFLMKLFPGEAFATLLGVIVNAYFYKSRPGDLRNNKPENV